MPAVKNVLKHVRVERAKGRRICERNRQTHVIKRGDLCLVVQNGQDAPNYCVECGTEILSLAQTTLEVLVAELRGRP